MGVSSFDEMRERYAAHYGVAAGYLPSKLDGLHEWLTALADEVTTAAERDEELLEHPSVSKLRLLIDDDRRVRALVDGMIEQSKGVHRYSNHPIENVEMLLAMMNRIIGRAPVFNPDPAKRNAFPMSSLFAYMMYTEAGWLGFRNEKLNAAIDEVLDEWGRFLNSPESKHVINYDDGWLSPPAARLMGLKDYIIPDPHDDNGGFGCYNDYFHRDIKLEARQLAGVDRYGNDETDVVVSSNDGTVFRIARYVQADAEFWTKDQPYSLRAMLDDEALAAEFVEGDVLQTFLSGDNYHHFLSPVAGTVTEVRKIPGLLFTELQSLPFDPGGGTSSLAYEACINTRAVIVIEADREAIGKVAVVPIGITEVSSIEFSVGPQERVEKGGKLGYFGLGGSTLCLVFQPGAIKEWRWPWPPADPNCPPTVDARDWIAIAH